MSLGYRVLRSVARLAFAAQMRLEISGVERLPRTGPVLFVSNHLGPTDQFAIAMRLPHELRILAKAEVFEWPVVGWLARRGEAIPIRRGEADREAMRTLRDLLLDGAAALVFPEGTYADADEPLGMIPVKTGAAWLAWRTGAWVAPVAITGTESIWTPGRGWRVWRRSRVRVVFGDPYQPVWPRDVAPKAALRIAADEMALRIAALLPNGYRGVYARPAYDAGLLRSALAADVYGDDGVGVEC
ncbi:MAG TPA: lysophospholipid acyltransferase family protein [Ktedonobacterales bacterium]|nr:lysophospholipid acyltransferase family protein [Ktedonobacterales bacterium]